ncbi:MAG: MFS transporter [Gemmatirosa sp.]
MEPGPGEAALERETVRRVTRRLIPLLFVLYVVSFLDRTNVALAALQMNRDLALSATAYGFGAGIFFVGYALFEVPSNMILARVGARRWIARIAITWGLLAAAMAFARGPASFYVLRFLLGVAEAGFLPGVIYYLALWFPDAHRARATSYFMLGIPLSGLVGGPLGGALLSLDGWLGLAGWQWLFVLEGLPAVVLGLVVLRRLTDRPADAAWLAPEQRAWLARRLETEHVARPAVHGGDLRTAFTSGTVWALSVPYLLGIVGGYAVTLWAPIMIRELLPMSDLRVSLVVGLLGLAGVCGMLVNGASSDRRGERLVHAAVPLVVSALGFLLAATTRQPVLAIAGLALVSGGVNAFLPVFWCLPSSFLRGVGAAAGIALINSIGNVGGFVGPTALGRVRASTGGFTAGLLVLAALALVAAVLMLALRASRVLARRPTAPA